MTDTEHRAARLTRASDVRTHRQKELLEQKIPLGTLTLVGGYAGEGKSSWLIHVSALGSTGQLPGDLLGECVPSVWVNIEDDPSRVQVPRLRAAGADLEHVHFLSMESTIDDVTRDTIPVLPMDVNAIRHAISGVAARLVVLDPASSLMAGDLNKREDARRSLDALSALAQELDIAIVLVMHLSKGRGRASEKISGSHALRDAVRSVLLIARDDETDNRIITLDKSNYSPHVGRSWAFSMADTEVLTDDGDTMHVGRVIDLGESELSVNEIINRDPEGEEQNDRNDAQSFILECLNEKEALEAPAGDVLKAGRAAGFSDNDLKDARRRSKNPRIETRKSGFGAGWVWAIAVEDGTKVANVAGPRTPATLATLGATLACCVAGCDRDVSELSPVLNGICFVQNDAHDAARLTRQPVLDGVA